MMLLDYLPVSCGLGIANWLTLFNDFSHFLQAKLYESQKDNQVLKDRRNTMVDKVEEDNVKLRQILLELKSTPVQTEAEPMEQAKLPQPLAVDPGWKDHVTKIEQELQALKMTLNLAPLLTGVTMTTPATSSPQEQEDLEERMTEMVLENRRLKLSNKKLTQQLLETTADDNGISFFLTSGPLGFFLFILRQFTNCRAFYSTHFPDYS
jgi:hypothetical protein